MKRQDKIKALVAFSKGNSQLLRDLPQNEKPLFIEYVQHKGLYYLDHGDLVMTEAEFERYTNGRQIIFYMPHNFREAFNNIHLPAGVTTHS